MNSKHWKKWQRQQGGACSASEQSSSLLTEIMAKAQGGLIPVLGGDKLHLHGCAARGL